MIAVAEQAASAPGQVHSTSEQHQQQLSKPKGGLFIAVFALSIPQYLLFGFWLLLSWSLNPAFHGPLLREPSHSWVSVIIASNAIAALTVMLGVSSSLGIYVGVVWLKRRERPDGIELVARRLARITTLITTHSITACLEETVLLTILNVLLYILVRSRTVQTYSSIATFFNVWVAIFILWHILMSLISGFLSRSTRKIAHLKQVVRGDLQFSICSSLLLMLSVAQLFTSVSVAWVVATEYHWGETSEGFAGFCFVVGCAVSSAAASIGAFVSGKHLLSNSNELVAKHVRIAAGMNACIAILGSVVAGPLRAAQGVSFLADSLVILILLTIVVALELRMWFLAERSTRSEDQNVLDSSDFNLGGQAVHAEHCLSQQKDFNRSGRDSFGNVLDGDNFGGGAFPAATELVAVELEQS